MTSQCCYYFGIYPTAPTAPPLNPFSDTVTSQSVNMTWFPPPLEHQNGIIQYYLVNVTELATGIVTSYNTTSAWLFLTGLHPFYDYRFVFAAATIGVGPTGSTTTITTLEAGMSFACLCFSRNFHYKCPLYNWDQFNKTLQCNQLYY